MSAVLRFAPSPNGRLHLGHAFSALLNAEIAARLGARLLLRIEDIDPIRSKPELIAAIHADLAWLGLRFDGSARRQSEHLAFYRRHLEALAARGLAYPCFCSRGQIAARIRAIEAAGRTVSRDPDGVPLYPGICRALSRAESEMRRAAGEPHAWRLDTSSALEVAPGPHRIRCFSPQPRQEGANGRMKRFPGESFGASAVIASEAKQSMEPRRSTRGAGLLRIARNDGGERHPFRSTGNDASPCLAARGPIPAERGKRAFAIDDISCDPSLWGDAVIGRRDVATSYHLCVVLDDDAQGITHVVRGKDLAAATSLHVLLQALLGLSSPAYHHHALIADEAGAKLAKSKGSQSLADLRGEGLTGREVRAMLGFA